MREIQRIVNDAKWQTLRRSFIGTWRSTPAKNVAILRNYLYEINPVPYRRFRQVYNYLTGSGFRIGVIRHKSIDALLKELRAMKKQMPKRG